MENKNILEKVAFGGGCFWCTEAVFKSIKGISKVLPGYAGGHTENPTYDQVCTGRTGHAEVVYLEYNPAQVNFKDLLTVFFGSHDPTTKDRQGNDVGSQYRSVIFFTTEDQRQEIEKFIEELNSSNSFGEPIVTGIEMLAKFYEAENYHKDYFANHKNAPYCELIINPKLEKVQKNFSNLLKKI